MATVISCFMMSAVTITAAKERSSPEMFPSLRLSLGSRLKKERRFIPHKPGKYTLFEVQL